MPGDFNLPQKVRLKWRLSRYLRASWCIKCAPRCPLRFQEVMRLMSDNESTRNIGNELLEESYAHFARSLDVIIIHLRDARNILVAVETLDTDRALAKSMILLASASVEANLASLSTLGVVLAEKYDALAPIQIDYLRGTQETIDDRGNARMKAVRQSLEDRLRRVPALLGQIFGIEFKYPDEDIGNTKLGHVFAYRDAIVHPRWQRYLNDVGFREAALAVDAAEWYLNAVATPLAPYLNFYNRLLYDMTNADGSSPGPVARRVEQFPPLDQSFTTMPAVGFGKVAMQEWYDMTLMTEFALDSQCEGDSDGSMLTRAGLVMLYAMLDAQMALNAQNYVYNSNTSFSPGEILFLTETALDLDAEGNVIAEDSHETFKKRMIGIPRVLSRKALGAELTISLGDRMGAGLLRFKDLRDAVMHPRVGEPLPRVTKSELRKAVEAVREYFERLASACPDLFGVYRHLLRLGEGRRSRNLSPGHTTP